jgi:predicted unusual protein kinase regulating ubiquinone biosynthesis (AarF/ABC1/UbiB family)
MARASRVPSGRLERLARLGWVAGDLFASGLAGGARRLLTGEARPAVSAAAARRLARRLSHLRGAAMKLGQMLSLESTDVLPREIAEALSVLRAHAEPMPESQVRRVLGREYGKGWQGLFREIELEPMAAASIGQVHAATAADGRELALKIQYPGVARSIDSDLENAAALLGLARLLPVEIDTSGLVAEAKRQLRREADYRLEAESLRRYRELVADEPLLRVPRAHDDLTRTRVLAMDRARGEPIESLAAPHTAQTRRDATGALLHRLLFRELFEFRFVQTDPNFGNYLVDPETGGLVLLDFGSTLEVSEALADRYARICRAILEGSRERVRQVAEEIGYLAPGDWAERARAIVDVILLVCEPLRHRGRYDFGASDLPARARDFGLDLALRRDVLRAPPPETVVLHRKLVGTFLLAAKIRARVDARAILLPFLDARSAASAG